ncbi:hypothetical protein MBLNU230_g6793t1 [Neophaeotheca triangularis]
MADTNTQFWREDPRFQDPTLDPDRPSKARKFTHDDLGEGTEIIVLAFSKEPKTTPEPWNNVTQNIILHIQEELDCHRSQRYASVRHIDHHNVFDVDQGVPSRVAEITIPLVRAGRHDKKKDKFKEPWTLGQCTALCNAPSFKGLQSRYGVELVIQPGELYKAHRTPGLAVFDMDSTLIQQEVIDELARAVGLYDQVAAITEAAMRGEAPYTDFETSLRARVGLLRGVPVGIWEQMKNGVISFTPGAKELVRVLRALGWKTAVLSGGFTPLAEWVKETLGLDYAFANHLVEEEGQGLLTGELVAGKPIIHAEKKRELLGRLAEENAIPTERVIAVGDGSNDLLMMRAAGLGIAFNAKPKVQAAAPARINTKGLLDVLHVLGYSSSEIENVLAREMVVQNGTYGLRALA